MTAAALAAAGGAAASAPSTPAATAAQHHPTGSSAGRGSRPPHRPPPLLSPDDLRLPPLYGRGLRANLQSGIRHVVGSQALWIGELGLKVASYLLQRDKNATIVDVPGHMNRCAFECLALAYFNDISLAEAVRDATLAALKGARDALTSPNPVHKYAFSLTDTLGMGVMVRSAALNAACTRKGDVSDELNDEILNVEEGRGAGVLSISAFAIHVMGDVARVVVATPVPSNSWKSRVGPPSGTDAFFDFMETSPASSGKPTITLWHPSPPNALTGLAGAAVSHYQLVAVVHNVDGALAVMPPQGLQRSDPSLLEGDIRAAVTARIAALEADLARAVDETLALQPNATCDELHERYDMYRPLNLPNCDTPAAQAANHAVSSDVNALRRYEEKIMSELERAREANAQRPELTRIVYDESSRLRPPPPSPGSTIDLISSQGSPSVLAATASSPSQRGDARLVVTPDGWTTVTSRTGKSTSPSPQPGGVTPPPSPPRPGVSSPSSVAPGSPNLRGPLPLPLPPAAARNPVAPPPPASQRATAPEPQPVRAAPAPTHPVAARPQRRATSGAPTGNPPTGTAAPAGAVGSARVARAVARAASRGAAGGGPSQKAPMAARARPASAATAQSGGGKSR